MVKLSVTLYPKAKIAIGTLYREEIEGSLIFYLRCRLLVKEKF